MNATTTPQRNISPVKRISPFIKTAATLLLIVFPAFTSLQAADSTWKAGGSAWYTGTNWVSGSAPGLQGVAASNTDIATFTSAFTGTTVGINMSTANLNLGAISIDSTRTTATNIGDSSATAGVLRLYGATVNSQANTILRNAGSGLLTLQAAQNGTMGVVLSNSIDNKIFIDSTGGITISANLTEAGAGYKLTLAGVGSGTLTLSGTNSYTGGTFINGSALVLSIAGDSQLGTAPVSAADNLTITAGRLEITGNTTINANRNILLGAIANTPSLSIKGSGTTVIYNGVFKDITSTTGTLVKQGAGTLDIGGQSTYSGATSINNGTVRLNVANDRLPTGTVVNLGQAVSTNLGTLDLNGRNQQIAGLSSTSGTNAGSSTNVVTSAASVTLTINNSSDYVYSAGTAANSGIISGAISLVKQGIGKQTFGGANAYTGTTTISAGTLALTGGGTLGSGNISIGGSGTLDISGITSSVSPGASGNFTTSTGASLVTASGKTLVANNIQLGGTSTVGDLTISGGGTITLSGTSIFDINGTTGNDKLIFSSGILNANSSTLTINTLSTTGLTGGSVITLFSNPSSYVGAFASIGFTGTLDAGYSWNTSSLLTNGTIVYTAGITALYWSGAGTGNPGSWSSTASGTGTDGVWADTNTGWVPSNTANFAGTAGAVTVTTVTANKGITFYTNGYTVSGGTITLSSTGANNVITTDSGVNATVSSALSTSAGISKSGLGTLIFNSAQTYTGGTIVSGGTLQLGDTTTNNGSVAGDITDNSAVAFANPNTQIYNGVISGSGSLSKSGAGTLTLNGTSTYQGGTTITAGTLALGNATDTLLDTGVVAVSGGTLDVGNNSDTVGAVTVSSGSIIGTGGTITADSYAVSNNSGTVTLSANLNGNGALTKTNAGSLLLSGSNTYLGGTQINGGSTTVSSDDNLGESSGVLGINGGTLSLTGAVTGVRALTIGTGGGTLTTGGNNFSTSNTAAVNGTLSTTGAGNVALNGTTTFGASGALSIGTGGSVTLGQLTGSVSMFNGGTFNGDLILTNAIRLNFTGSFGGTGSIKVTSTGTSLANTGTSVSGTISSNIVLNSGGAAQPFVVNLGATSGNNLTVNGIIYGDSDLNLAVGASGGAGILTLGAQSTYTGNTTINNSSGGIIKLGITNALPTTTQLAFGTVTGAGPGTLDLNGFNQTVAALSFGGLGTAANAKITNSATGNSVFTVNGSATPANAYSGIIQDGGTGKTVSLVKDGSNTLTLAGANTYTGGTTINGGTLKLGGSGNILADSGAVTVGGGTFDINSANETVGAVTLNSGSIINSGVDQAKALTGSSYDVKSGTVSAVLAGSGITLTKNTDGSGSGGTVRLSAANTYTGVTTVNDGTLLVNNAAGSGTGTGNVIVNSNGTLGGSGIISTSTNNSISGTGTIMVGDTHGPSGAPTAPPSLLTLQTGTGGAITLGGMVQFDIFDNTGSYTSLGDLRVYTPSSSNDQLSLVSMQTNSNLVLTGDSILSVKINSSLTFADKDAWQLFDWGSLYANDGTNGSIGSFTDAHSLALLPEISGFNWNTSKLYSNGIISLDAVPEPSRAVLMLFGAAGLLMRRRRKTA